MRQGNVPLSTEAAEAMARLLQCRVGVHSSEGARGPIKGGGWCTGLVGVSRSHGGEEAKGPGRVWSVSESSTILALCSSLGLLAGTCSVVVDCVASCE